MQEFAAEVALCLFFLLELGLTRAPASRPSAVRGYAGNERSPQVLFACAEVSVPKTATPL